MSAPRLNRRMVLESPVRAPDGLGGYAEGWAVEGTVWAELMPGNGREVLAAGLTLAAVPWRITLRGAPFGAPSRPRAGQRLREGTRVFAIHAVAERDAGGRYLTCFAREEEGTA